MGICESLEYISQMTFPQVKVEWNLYYIKKGTDLFETVGWCSNLCDYISTNYKEGLIKLLDTIENGELSGEVYPLSRQLLISLANCTINRGNERVDNKPGTAYALYKNNPLFREATIEYAVYAPKLISNLLSYSFFEIDFEMVKRMFDECVQKYDKQSERYKTLIELLHDKFTYNRAFSLMVGESNVFQYWEIAEYINTNIPILSFYETNFGSEIHLLKEDINEIEALAPLRKLVEEQCYWTGIEELPEILEFDYLYPNGSNGDMIKYILEEYGENKQVSATTWHGKISKDHLDLFEIFSVVAPYITTDINFLSIYEHHNATILRSKLFARTSSRFVCLKEYREYEQLLYSYKSEQKRKRTELYSKLILQGNTSPKWKSEAQLFTLVSNIYPDAIYQYRSEWLGMQSLDIYIPSQSIGIEYQGRQHYEPVKYFGGEKHFTYQQRSDERKRNLCADHGIKLIEWPYTETITESNVIRRLEHKMNDKRTIE